MEYRNELNQKLSVLCNLINRISPEAEGLPLIDKDIIMEKLRTLYSIVNDIPVLQCPETLSTITSDRHATKIGQHSEAPEMEPVSIQSEDPTPIVQVAAAQATTFTSSPIFAAEETQDNVESIAEPLLDDAERNDYEKLFDEEISTEANDIAAEEINPQPESEFLRNESNNDHEIDSSTPEPLDNQEITNIHVTTPEQSDSSEDKGYDEPTTGEQIDEESQTGNDTASSESNGPDKTTANEPSLFDYLSRNAEAKHTQTIGDKFEQDHSTIGEHISQQATIHKVSDLRKVININDKFSFVGTLFHNNMRAYTDFILRLNAIDNRTEALNYISEVAQQYNWDMDSLEVKTFNKILDRKF